MDCRSGKDVRIIRSCGPERERGRGREGEKEHRGRPSHPLLHPGTHHCNFRTLIRVSRRTCQPVSSSARASLTSGARTATGVYAWNPVQHHDPWRKSNVNEPKGMVEIEGWLSRTWLVQLRFRLRLLFWSRFRTGRPRRWGSTCPRMKTEATGTGTDERRSWSRPVPLREATEINHRLESTMIPNDG
jgi:hypothetical protein